MLVTFSFFGLDYPLTSVVLRHERSEVVALLYYGAEIYFWFGHFYYVAAQEKHSLIPFFVMRDVNHCKLKAWQDSI